MRVFARQLWFEIVKLFARKRTYMGFGFFILIEMLILLGTQLPRNRQMMQRELMMDGLDLSHYFGGLTVAFQVIAWTMGPLGSIYLALVGGDIIAKEVEDGTMRMILSRPVSRLRVLVLKYLACAFYTLALTLFVVGTSLGACILFKGAGGLVVMAPWEHVNGVFETQDGFERFALATVALIFCLMTITTVGFMFSSFNLKPASATILTLSVFFIDYILDHIALFRDLQGYFISHRAGVWQHFFEPTIPWKLILGSAGYLAAFDLIILAIAACYFVRRDFKS